MVATRSFLIDATFLLEDAEKAFLGVAAIIDAHGKNNSVVYGAVRAMLKGSWDSRYCERGRRHRNECDEGIDSAKYCEFS